MKFFAGILVVAILGLTALSLVWLNATVNRISVADGETAEATLLAFQRSAPAGEKDIDLGTIYARRPELLDVRTALPNWHRYPRDEAVRLYSAIKQCPPTPTPSFGDVALRKAYAWHERTCAGGSPPGDFIDHAPLMHPSGRSYAALARALEGGSPHTTRATARSFHVLELAGLAHLELNPIERDLSAIPAAAWDRIVRGDRLVMTPSLLVIADHGLVGVTRLRTYPRRAWEAFVRDAPVWLAPRAPTALCARPASPELCWESRSMAQRRRPLLLGFTGVFGLLALLSSVALAQGYARERRRVHQDRLHVLRTLTHELRTPATSLRLELEPLRAAFDELPASCQEPLLRLSDGVERLLRTLHRTARYMALFETGTPPAGLLNVRRIDSARDMFEEFAMECPPDVTWVAASEDAPVQTDPEWLSVAVRNLVENGVRHGKPPVSVTWSFGAECLLVRVADGGTSPTLSLSKAIAPFGRDTTSTGLGLGLAIVDRIAQLLGGRLSHQSSPTVFELRLPTTGSGS